MLGSVRQYVTLKLLSPYQRIRLCSEWFRTCGTYYFDYYYQLLAALMRNNLPKWPSGAPLHDLSKFYNVVFGFAHPLFIWDNVLLYLRPTSDCYRVVVYLSSSWPLRVGGYWSSVFIRRIIYTFWNVCPLITQPLRLTGRFGSRRLILLHQLGSCRYSNWPF